MNFGETIIRINLGRGDSLRETQYFELHEIEIDLKLKKIEKLTTTGVGLEQEIIQIFPSTTYTHHNTASMDTNQPHDLGSSKCIFPFTNTSDLKRFMTSTLLCFVTYLIKENEIKVDRRWVFKLLG